MLMTFFFLKKNIIINLVQRGLGQNDTTTPLRTVLLIHRPAEKGERGIFPRSSILEMARKFYFGIVPLNVYGITILDDPFF